MDISTPFDLAILARSDCIVHPHKTKLLCQCHCSENNSDQKSKNSTHSRSKKCKSRSRSPEVFAIVTSSNLMSSSSSNNEGIVIEFFEFMSDCLSVSNCILDIWSRFYVKSMNSMTIQSWSGFSSNSSNGSFGTSPVPALASSSTTAVPSSTSGTATTVLRNMRAQSATPDSSSRQVQLQKSASELSVKHLGHHQRSQESWLRIVPSYKVRPRNCDEVPEEFKRAGIGLCFGGKLISCCSR